MKTFRYSLLFCLYSFAAEAKPKRLPCEKIAEVLDGWVQNTGAVGPVMRTNRGWEDLRREWTRRIETFPFSNKHPEISKILDLENLRGKKILDAGTGDGGFVEDLKKHEIDVIGVDIALNEDQRRKSYFIQADIRQTGLAPNSFDLIVSSYSVFHYFFHQDPPYKAALKELQRLLRPGGKLVLIKAFYGLDEVKAAKDFKMIFPPNQDMNIQFFLLEKKK